MRVLVTGATGYIGGRLIPLLLDHGIEVRAATRDPSRLSLAPWRDRIEVAEADVELGHEIRSALDGCDAAFYLIHAMGATTEDFAERDRRAATNFLKAAEQVGLGRIVYLGALGNEEEDLSLHLRSRHEIGEILASGSIPVTEFRAAIIIGSGSVSFELIRHLTEVLPVMFRPQWTRTLCQPIAVRNVLQILVRSLDDPSADNHVYEIGGPDVLTYEQMIQIYAEEAGLRHRLVIPVPLFSNRLAPRVISLITPLVEPMIQPLLESLSHDVVVREATPPYLDEIQMFSYREGVRLAVSRVLEEDVATRWSDAVTQPALPLPGDPHWSGAKMLGNIQTVETHEPADDVFWAVTRIGGDVGYYTMNWAWQLRGWFDSLIGGVGLRRGRRHPEKLRKGEALDFFRVVEILPGQHALTLQAEMKVPGIAWLGWTIESTADGSRLTQRAQFIPRGLLGRLYWWALLPFHAPIFRRMALGIVAAARRRPDADASSS